MLVLYFKQASVTVEGCLVSFGIPCLTVNSLFIYSFPTH